jgi:retinol dehydrogenase-14
MDRMSGKQVVITGGTSGIGRAMAEGLARKGAAVAIIGRDRREAEDVLSSMRTATGRDDFNFYPADLSVMREVRDLADRLKGHYSRIDVLMNNAGGFFLRRSETADGLERTLAVNHLAAFLLTNLLMERLLAAEAPRIVTTSSAAHRSAHIQFDDLNMRRSYSGWAAYGQSKLANILFTRELARRLPPGGPTANAFHPGFVNSNLARPNPFLRPIVGLIFKLVAKSPEQGARTGIYLASSAEVADISGKYFLDERPIQPGSSALSREAARRLWEESASMVRLEAGEMLAERRDG